jgi:LPLT family lysophospholipid transporter-like MFS transporter
VRPPGALRLVVAGQFFGACADSALLVVALQALAEEHAPGWQAPALRILFYGAYVLLAVVSGALADAFAKSDVLIATGLLKAAGCAMLAAGASPLAAYAFVGFAAVSHMPARYGILGEIEAPEGLPRANAWLEGATLFAMLAGVGLGGALLSGTLRPAAGASSAHPAAAWLLVPYLGAVTCSMFVPRTPAAAPSLRRFAAGLPRQFGEVARALLAQPAARKALAFTTTFWAMAAVLQFEVLRWGSDRFGLPLAKAVLLQLVVALGMIAGAAAAGRWATTAHVRYVAWAGAGAGLVMAALALVHDLPWALALLAALGGLAGLVLVPMNAVVQEHGARAGRPGEWLAVQHFAENAASLLLLALYGAAIAGHLSTTGVIMVLGALVAMPSIAAGWAGR